jgi:hypothetical protein
MISRFVTKAWLDFRLQEDAAYQYEHQLQIHLISSHTQVKRVVLQLIDGGLTIQELTYYKMFSNASDLDTSFGMTHRT